MRPSLLFANRWQLTKRSTNMTYQFPHRFVLGSSFQETTLCAVHGFDVDPIRRATTSAALPRRKEFYHAAATLPVWFLQ